MLASQTRLEMLRTILDNVETAIAVLDAEGRAVYLNARAGALLECAEGEPIPTWLAEPLAPALERLFVAQSGDGVLVERCVGREMMVRVRVRSLDRTGGLIVLELVPTHAAGRRLVEPLAQGLGLSIPDARLLAFLWRGMSNEEIAKAIGIHLGTVKSRLHRLYHRLGVRSRASAVVRAAEILSPGGAQPTAANDIQRAA
jgi:DNA-binding CsgD family transcriptional regulator